MSSATLFQNTVHGKRPIEPVELHLPVCLSEQNADALWYQRGAIDFDATDGLVRLADLDQCLTYLTEAHMLTLRHHGEHCKSL